MASGVYRALWGPLLLAVLAPAPAFATNPDFTTYATSATAVDTFEGCRRGDNLDYGPDPAAGRCSVTPFSERLDGPLGMGGLQDYMRTNNLRSVDEVLPCLPAEYRRNYTMVYDSGSLHSNCASPESPRLILFSDDGRTMISMPGDRNVSTAPPTGDYSTDNCQSIEMFRQNPDSTYSTASIRFTRAATATGTGPAFTTERNPASCTSCHGTPFRPKWDKYPRWPGVYGSDDDSTYISSRPGYASSAGGRARAAEAANLARFRARKATTDRYRFLIDPPGTTTPPVNSTNVQTNFQSRPNLRLSSVFTQQNTERIVQRMSDRPAFAERSYTLTARFLGCETFSPPSSAEASRIASRKASLLLSFQQRENRVTCRQLRLLGTSRRCATAQEESTTCLPERLRGSRYSCIDASDTTTQSQAQSLAELMVAAEDLGVPETEFSMGVPNGTPDYGSGLIFDNLRARVSGLLMKKLASRDPSLSGYLEGPADGSSSCFNRRPVDPATTPPTYTEGSSPMCSFGPGECLRVRTNDPGNPSAPPVCQALSQSAARTGACPAPPDGATYCCGIGTSIPAPALAPVVAVVTPGARLINERCASCHGPGGMAEDINFSSPTALKSWLGSTRSGAAASRTRLAGAIAGSPPRMPMGGTSLTSTESTNVRAYIDELVTELPGP